MQLTDHQPIDYDSAVQSIIDSLTNEDKDFILREQDAASVHHFAGRSVRNHWQLWDRSTPFVKWCAEYLGIGHADDISGAILDGVWARVRGEPFSVRQPVERCRRHWLAMGLDPVTQQPLNPVPQEAVERDGKLNRLIAIVRKAWL